MAMRRMMQEVPNADVVITNPTHYAVALKYEDGKMEAPVVVAKGADYMAMKIKEVAKTHGVVTVENRPLAQALYRQTEVGDMIPEAFFKGSGGNFGVRLSAQRKRVATRRENNASANQRFIRIVSCRAHRRHARHPAADMAVERLDHHQYFPCLACIADGDEHERAA
ncbi:hypothetical protein DI43_04895 [Geobacillus sp. CAMR12739]|nr:hypothetical protein DI43_04895 [Geobacillus sp. CAMR12739]